MNTVLVIEDIKDNFDLIADALEDTYQVLDAPTGQEGLNQARTHKPDLILLDISLPDIAGYDVARMIKAEQALAEIPLIAITAHAMTGDRKKCIAAGCDDYMAKPIHVQELLTLISRHLNQEDSMETSAS